jgi:hypothetical protein
MSEMELRIRALRLMFWVSFETMVSQTEIARTIGMLIALMLVDESARRIGMREYPEIAKGSKMMATAWRSSVLTSV